MTRKKQVETAVFTTIVGSKELVDFPDLALLRVPAKIDTGADSSAIWASNIREENGVLHYVLFDKASPYYTGNELSTTKFSVISVKNSFGHTEFRYKISLKVCLAERTISVRFTLANRENNSQPILIGRRTLHGKFLVDVAAPPQDDSPQRLLLMSGEITPSVTNFVQQVMKSVNNLDIVHTTYDDIQFSFGPHGSCVSLLSTGDDIASFDIVHFKTSRQRDITAAMSRYLKQRGVKVVDEISQYFASTSKLYQYMILADNDIAIPPSLFIALAHLPESYEKFVGRLGVPFVLKSLHASKGNYNYLIRTKADFERACQEVQKDQVLVIGQHFIPNSGDYRVLVLGRRIALAIYRSRLSEDTHLNNTSQGGDARLAPVSELPTDVQTTSLEAARMLGLGVAGVDMVEETGTGLWYCFEVNDGPQIATGAFQKEKQQAFARFIETELSK